jgi:RNA polymerase sigma-70 factor (ECF subfamily)
MLALPRVSIPVSAEAAFRLHRRRKEWRIGNCGIAGDERWGELLAAGQSGDAGAYRLFLKSIIPFVRTLARRRSWSEDAVDDVVQDVLLTVHRVRHTYRPGQPVKPWLTAIVARRSIDALRRRSRIGAREVNDRSAYETFSDPAANKEEAGDPARLLAGMTAALSPGQKEALELVKLREMSLADASAASGQSVASLKVNIHRAIKKLRSNFGKGPAE